MDAACLYLAIGLGLFVGVYWKDIRSSPSIYTDIAMLFFCLWFAVTWPAYTVPTIDALLEKY